VLRRVRRRPAETDAVPVEVVVPELFTAHRNGRAAGPGGGEQGADGRPDVPIGDGWWS
jgi:hypothetical protein